MPYALLILGGVALGVTGSYVVSDSLKTALKWSALGAGVYLIAKKVKK